MKARKSEEILTEEGLATYAALGRTADWSVKRVKAVVGRSDQHWATIYFDWVINGMYSRNVLPQNIRELCAVAALTVQRSDSELESHIHYALGLNPVESVKEVILQMGVYAGVPAAHNGLRILEKVLASRKAKGLDIPKAE